MKPPFERTVMSSRTGQVRGSWIVQQILDSPAYQQLRARLPLATAHKPKAY